MDDNFGRAWQGLADSFVFVAIAVYLSKISSVGTFIFNNCRISIVFLMISKILYFTIQRYIDDKLSATYEVVIKNKRPRANNEKQSNLL